MLPRYINVRVHQNNTWTKLDTSPFWCRYAMNFIGNLNSCWAGILDWTKNITSITIINFTWPLSPQLVCNQGNNSVVNVFYSDIYYIKGAVWGHIWHTHLLLWLQGAIAEPGVYILAISGWVSVYSSTEKRKTCFCNGRTNFPQSSLGDPLTAL